MSTDPRDPICLTLSRETWLALVLIVCEAGADLLNDADDTWDPEAQEELRQTAREDALKILPPLLVAMGRGPGGDYPTAHEVWQAAEALWNRLGERPERETWQKASILVGGCQDTEREPDHGKRACLAISHMLDTLVDFDDEGDAPISPRGAENIVAILGGYDGLREKLEVEGYRPPYAFYDEPWMRKYAKHEPPGPAPPDGGQA